MGEPARKIQAFEELLAEIDRLPEYLSGEILEPGVIRTMSRPATPHRRAAGMCYRSLGGADKAWGGVGWWIEQEPAVRFGERLANPDLAGWRVERCPDPPQTNPITIVPDFCCEVLSPSTMRDDRKLKLPLYARSGVSWVWLIDPAAHLVEVFQTQNGKPTLVMSAAEDETTRLPPFDLDISFGVFWMPEENPEPSSP